MEQTRKSGLTIIGDVPWGTHLCLFYQTQEDLISILAPYFKAGLENNEFCMWVTSEPLSVEKAKKAMRKAVPKFEQCLEKGQIEIVPHTEWYLKGGTFDLQRVLNAWIEKLSQARAKGYAGMRVTGDAAGFKIKDWGKITDYEEKVNKVIGNYPILAVCSYSLDKCGASEIIEVVSNHRFALIRREGRWETIESAERKQMNEKLNQAEKMAAIGKLIAKIAHEINNPLVTILGFVQVYLSEMPKDDPKYKDFKRIEAAALRCRETIRGLSGSLNVGKNASPPA